MKEEASLKTKKIIISPINLAFQQLCVQMEVLSKGRTAKEQTNIIRVHPIIKLLRSRILTRKSMNGATISWIA